MNTVKIKRVDLLAKLKENREAHVSGYADAVEGWKVTVEKSLKDALKVLKKEGKFNGVYHNAPIDNKKDYDKAITKFEMSVDDVIELEDHEFNQYVMDEWQWKSQVFGVNNAYSAVVGKAR